MTTRFLRVSASVTVLLVLVLLSSATLASAREVAPSPRHETQTPLTLTTKSVKVGKDPESALYDPTTKEVYVVNYGADTVSAISSASTPAVVATITVGKAPSIITYAPSTGDLYVGNLTEISIISSANTVVHTVTFPPATFLGAEIYDPANGDVYVLVSGTSIDQIAQTSPFALTSIPLPTGALFVTYDNASKSIVVSSGESGKVTAISSTDKTTTVTLPKGAVPEWMVYDPHDSDLYITWDTLTAHGFAKTGNVSVLTSANKITKTIKIGAYPSLGWYDPANFEIYEMNTGLQTPPTYVASTISIITGTTLTTTLTVGKDALIAFYDPKNTEMYVACPASNLTYAITSANAITAMVVTKQNPGVAIYDPGLGETLAIGETEFNGHASTAKTLLTVIPSTNTGPTSLSLAEGPAGGAAYDPTDSGFFVVNSGAGTVSVIL